MLEKCVVSGENFTDHRGSVRFFNGFNMNEVVRFYEITPADSEQIRGWQAHKIEKKWFYCLRGGFIINIIKVDNFEKPSNKLEASKYILNDIEPKVLCVPQGYATAFKAINENAALQVFSNFSLDESKNDDFRFSLERWSADWKI
ncbi:MAG: dTDP-6-deoxy-3,4-keto-hexulose isomerase [Croceivirga sp.]